MAEFFWPIFPPISLPWQQMEHKISARVVNIFSEIPSLGNVDRFLFIFLKSFMLITLWADPGKNSSPWQRYEPSARTLTNTARRSIRNSICQFSRTTGQSVAMATASGFIFVKIVLNECSCSYVRLIRRSADFRLFLGGFTHAHAVHVRIVQSGRK